jgi:hypothetical protein
MLVPGDELIDVNSSGRYWVVNSPVAGSYQNRLIDENGNIVELNNVIIKLLRSGRRNMATATVGTITSLANPFVAGKLSLSAVTKILNAKAIVFNEEWSTPFYCKDCPSGYTASDDGTYCYKDTLAVLIDTMKACEGDQIGPYSSCGSAIYSSYNTDMSHYERNQIDKDNSFWIGFTADQMNFCDYDPGTQMRAARSDNSKSEKLIAGKNLTDTGKLGKLKVANSINMAARLTSVGGPLNRCGIWSCDSVGFNVWIGFSRVINVSETKTYYVGLGADNQFRLLINGEVVVQDLLNDPENFKIWHIFPVVLTRGQHIIEMQAMNTSSSATFGAEIYDNTAAELAAATSYGDIDTVFSTRNMLGQYLHQGNYSCPAGYALNTDSTPYSCRKIYYPNQIFNPYYKGVLGNWRAKSSYVYRTNRSNTTSDPELSGSTNIRTSGAYSSFSPFWTHVLEGENLVLRRYTGDANWIAANEVTYFNTKGLEVENKDALNRYTSVLFGYLESMPLAVASNTRYRELAYDGFEDYGFSLDCSNQTCNRPLHFNFHNNLNGSTIDTTTSFAHSGKYSLKLNGTLSMTKTVYETPPSMLYSFDVSGRYLLKIMNCLRAFHHCRDINIS